MSVDHATNPIATQPTLRLGLMRRLRIQRRVSCSLAVCFAVTGTANALGVGEAAVKSALGEPLLVEIPYRLAANERIAADCVSLARPVNGGNGPPSYTLASRITISATHIQIFGSPLVREPLIGLDVRIQCVGVPHIVRSYVLFIDPPVQTSAVISSSPDAVATYQQVQSAAVAAPVGAVPARQVASPRARGEVGDQLTQGQTYRIVRGDTLSGIASRVAGRPGTIWQTTDAVFDANPQAFRNANPDLILEGQSITIPVLTDSSSAMIPVVTVEAATSAPEQSELPSVRLPEPIEVFEPLPLPNVARTESIATPVSSVLTLEPVATPLEIGAMPATTPADVTLSGPTEVTTKPLSTLVYVLLAIGAVFLLLLAPALTLLRKRSARGVSKFLDTSEDAAPSTQATTVVENGAADSLEDGTTRSLKLSASAIEDVGDQQLSVSKTGPVDLDTGMPSPSDLHVEWFGSQPEEDVGDATTVVMSRVEAERKRDSKTEKARTRAWRDERNTQTITMVEVELLRQDYEAERTMTQQNSQALRDAVAELKATDAAFTAGAEKPTDETLESAQTAVMEHRAETPAAGAEPEADTAEPSKRRA